jgi:exopolysaccharide/PEP-CTERM locus tyrosine autokinase
VGKIYDALRKAQREAELRKMERVRVPEAPSGGTHAEAGTDSARRSSLKGFSEKLSARVPAPGRAEGEPLILDQPKSWMAEQFRMLRSRIVSSGQERRLRTILVTSALPGEGKTMVAANLAISIARGLDEHVLLVDADMRSPSVHELFALGPSDGLVSFLLNEHRLSDVLQKTRIEKLTVLPCGTSAENPAELLASQKMRHLVEEVGSRYDDRYIVFDCTPVQQTPEPRVLGELVDGVLLVVQAEKTSRQVVRNTVNLLGQDKILGIVFNRCDQALRTYHDYHYAP